MRPARGPRQASAWFSVETHAGTNNSSLIASQRGIWPANAVAACPGLSAVRDYPPEGGQFRGSDAGRPQDGIPSVHELGGVYVAVAGWSAGGEWKVRGDQPEGNERHPEHRAEHVPAGGLADPVRLPEDQVRAPPHHRIGWVHQVQNPGAVPGRALRGNACRRIVGEPDDLPVLVNGLDL